MGKLKSILIGAAAICCPFLAGTSTSAGEALRTAAYYSAGVTEPTESGSSSSDNSADSSAGSMDGTYTSAPPQGSSTDTSESRPDTSSGSGETSSGTSGTSEPQQKLGTIIVKNRPDNTDNVDYSLFQKESGSIYRYNFGKSKSTDHITLRSGAQVRNCSAMANSELAAAAEILPSFGAVDSEQPSVLIYHTHTCESFLPYGDSFDKDYPLRSSDPSKNMIAVGDAICESLSKRGISTVHDCTVYDHPMFTGAYYRSADGMQEILEEYPSIKIVLDIHRDGIINPDGSLAAPIAEIGGKNAAQFMIISGCDDDGELGIPYYMENFKLACLLQNCAEDAYPDLARALLFDYRNYNQHLSTGALLIEVGSHGNSLDEVIYTGELLGNIIADAFAKAE